MAIHFKILKTVGKIAKKALSKKQNISFKVKPPKKGLDMNYFDKKKYLFETSKHRNKMQQGVFHNKKDEMAYRSDVNNVLARVGKPRAGESGSKLGDFAVVDDIGMSRKAAAAGAMVGGMPDRTNVKNKSGKMMVELKKVGK